MKYAKYIVYLIATLAFLLICWFSFTIYTSLMGEHLPWYEPCGMQFLAILIFSCPVMFGVGVVHLVLARFMPVGKPTRILPFAAGVTIGALVFIDGSLGSSMQWTGAACCVLAALLAIVFAIRDLKAKRTSEQFPPGDTLKVENKKGS